MAEFRRALGWAEDAESEPAHRLFQGTKTNGIVVALYAAKNYERDFGPRANGCRRFTLGLNLASPEEVDRVYELFQSVEARSCSRSRSTRHTASAASACAIPRGTSGTWRGNAGRPSLPTAT